MGKAYLSRLLRTPKGLLAAKACAWNTLGSPDWSAGGGLDRAFLGFFKSPFFLAGRPNKRFRNLCAKKHFSGCLLVDMPHNFTYAAKKNLYVVFFAG